MTKWTLKEFTPIMICAKINAMRTKKDVEEVELTCVRKFLKVGALRFTN
jgi:hypothetical protein